MKNKKRCRLSLRNQTFYANGLGLRIWKDTQTSLLKENKKLKAACRKLMESNKFYADIDSWGNYNNTFYEIRACDHEIGELIIDIDGNEFEDVYCGGKLARETEVSPEVKAIKEILK